MNRQIGFLTLKEICILLLLATILLIIYFTMQHFFGA